ncbi:MAG TPA: ABC transporter ATP-binding protein [Thermoplasmata archaeon]|nr:ABC transporter ATP-binding protein [Thermoplasmata archaeon]
MASERRTPTRGRHSVARATAWVLLAVASLATILYGLKVIAGVTVPGLYVRVLPELSDGVKVGLLWLPTGGLVIALLRRKAAGSRAPVPEAEAFAPPAGEDGGPIVVARSLTKVYDTGAIRVPALQGIDLAIEKGEMVAIMGPSGCGKTTLLNVLSGIDDASSGEVLIGSRSLGRMTDNEKTDFRANRIGFVFQSYNLLPVLSAVENVELPLLVLGRNPMDARERALRSLEAVGLTGEADKRPMEMSGGQQQRVAIARALVNDPDIVFADEPTGNLDSDTSADVVALLRRLNREMGRTFLIVTHDPEVSRATERIVHMRNGRIERELRTGG